MAKAMPVVLHEEDCDGWLDRTGSPAGALIGDWRL